MLKIARKEKIIELLNISKNISINDLCKNLDVSLSTLHRDLNDLEREGRIKKVFGGVVLNSFEDTQVKNILRLNTNIELKKRIALKAMEFVKNEECIFLDNSSTCYYLAKEISEANYKNLVIVTNSILIPNLFVNNEHIQVVSTGGLFIKEMGSFAGPCAISAINEFNGHKLFFSVASVSLDGNLSDIYNIDLVTVKREMFKKSRERICLVDSSKFNKIGQSKIFDLNEVDIVISDSNCNKEKREELLKFGVNLIIV